MTTLDKFIIDSADEYQGPSDDTFTFTKENLLEFAKYISLALIHDNELQSELF